VRTEALAAVLVACLSLVATAGCGSSARARTATGGSSAAQPTTSTSGGLKVTTAPNYASPPASAPVQSGVVPVSYRNITIRPDTLRVRVGATVVWTNYDPLEHNVTSQSGPVRFASKNIREGERFSVKMTRAGVIHYLCTIHPASMNGTIEVVR
jgi:plastocyanin